MDNSSNENATSLDGVLASLQRLPTLPVVVQEVIASFHDGQVDRRALAHKISRDQGLSAKVLQVANSPFYGLSRKIGSIDDASMVLGLHTLRSLTLAAGLMLAFPSSAGGTFDRRAYWRRSCRVAAYAQALARALGQEPQLAFIIGMFHDIGQLVLDVCLPERFASLLARRENSATDLLEIEREELGFDHAMLGAELARRWNFPHEIEYAIHYWRTPEHEPFEYYPAMVLVAVLLESGLIGEALLQALPPGLRERLQPDWQRIEAELPTPEQLEAISKLMAEV